jgi:hypothetical protein
MSTEDLEESYGHAGHIYRQEEETHLLAQEIMVLQNKIVAAGMMLDGDMEITLAPSDGKGIFIMRCTRQRNEIRIRPVLHDGSWPG